MNGKSFDVRIHKVDVYQGKRTTTHWVRWSVDRKAFKEPFKTAALADSFRSKLVTATRNGEAFDKAEGLPVTMLRSTNTSTWFAFACSYVDMKWGESSPGQRRTIADTLTPITVSLLSTDRGRPDEKSFRKALRVAFNAKHRDGTHAVEVSKSLQWLEKNTRPVSDLADPKVLRRLLSDVEIKLDGSRAAYNTIRLRRTTLGSALDFAVEAQLLDVNPLDEVKTKKRKTVVHEVDRRSVANPIQARTLLNAVSEIQRSGPALAAFFGLMYFAALRPEEAANLRSHNLTLPESGWGEIRLEKAAPEIGAEWTDSGQASEERGLKHREVDHGRTVPCSPQLTAMLRHHLDAFGTGRGGLLFRAERGGGRIGSTVYGRLWAKAREAVLTPEVVASPLAKRPYDLRHAAVSTWLNAGVEATRVAEWAGHSVAVLLRTYAKCLDGGEQTARDRVQAALGTPQNFGTYSAQTPVEPR